MKAESSEHSTIDPADDARPYRIHVLLLFLLGLGLTVWSRLFNLTRFGLWMDEVFSFRLAKSEWSGLFQQAIYDAVHPPFFYLLLKFWIMIGGESLLWLKVFPVIFALGAVGLLYLLCRELKITLAEFSIALLFLSLNSYLIYYAQELRMYSLLALLSLLSMWIFIRFLRDESNSKRYILLLFLVNLLLIYTQYFGWMTVLAECVVVFIYGRAKIKVFLIHTFALGLCFLPWCVLVVSAIAQKGGLAQNLRWIDKPGIAAIPQFLADVNGNPSLRYATSLSLLIFLPPILLWLWQIYRDRDRQNALIFVFLGSIVGLPIVIAFLVSQISATSIWVDRYFIAAAIPYMLLAAVSAARIRHRLVRGVFVTLMICWSLGAGFWNIFQHRPRVDWRSFASRISSRPESVFVVEDWAGLPLQQLLGTHDLSAVRKVDRVEVIEGKQFWLSYRQTAWKDPQSPIEKMVQKNCIIEDQMADQVDGDTVHLLLVGCQ